MIPASPSSPTLLRALGPGAAIAVVVGNTIGSGIFLKPGTIARDGGDFRLILGAWIVGGLVCLLGALSLAELAAMFPHAGGLYVYLREAYGRPAAFLFGWNEFLFARPGSVGALAVAFCGAAAALAGVSGPLDPWTEAAGALTLIAAMTTVNYVGVLWGSHVQVATTIVKVAGVGAIASVPWLFAAVGAGGIDAANYATTYSPAATNSSFAAQLGLVFLAVMWAYDGWHGVTPVAEEIRRPERNVPLALIAGIGILALLYVSANVAYHGVLSMDEMAIAGERASSLVAGRLFGPWGAAALSAVILISTLGALNSNTLLGPRVSFAMARDGLFFGRLARIHPAFRTPGTAIVVQGLIAGGLIVAAGLSKQALAGYDAAALGEGVPRRLVESLQRDSIFTLLTNLVVFSAGIFYALAVSAVVVLRVRRPAALRPYRAWGFPISPAIFLAFYAWFLWRIYWDKPLEANLGLGLLLLGLPVYWLFARRGTA